MVLVKKDERQETEERVSKLLAPYDEQLEVPEYEKDCYCVGSAAHRRAYDAMQRKFGTITTREALKFGKETFEADA